MLAILDSQNSALTPTPSMQDAGQAANVHAARATFSDYKSRKAAQTLRRQSADLALFAEYLQDAGVQPGDLESDPESWRGVTWGLVSGFVQWQLQKGYAIGSIGVRLATVKGYAKLAAQAGVLSPADYAMITTVKGYGHKEGKRIDDQRTDQFVPTRLGAKKAEPVQITPEQAGKLLARPWTPQGRRDALLMALFLEHGLRVGEMALLQVSDFNLQSGELKFFRPKVDKTQIHRLTPKTLKAARDYFENDAPATGVIWRASASKRDGKAAQGSLTDQGMSERAMTKRVEALGRSVGIVGLSAHDNRHHWATTASRSGTPIDRLQEAGGWNSPAMPLRYVNAAKIANDGVRLE